MTDEQLKLFCGREDTKYTFTRPFNKGQWRYATDGRICVRAWTDAPDDEGKFPPADGLFNQTPMPTDWRDWPEPLYREGWEKCSRCEGYGVTDRGKTCARCEGNGLVLMPVLEVSARKVALRYDKLIRSLPEPKYGDAFREADDPADKPLWFKFGGGEGLVMGLRGFSPVDKEIPLRI